MAETKSKPRAGLYSLAAAETGGIIDSPLFKEKIKDLFGAVDKKSPAGAATAADLIVVIVQLLLLVAASIAVIFLMIGGYRYVAARGSEEATEAAKKTMTSSILGLVIIILAFAIIRVIVSVLLQGQAGLGGELGTP